MLKSELIKKLREIDGEVKVWLSSDAEGNRFSELVFFELSDTFSDGTPCHPDDAESDCEKVVVLWP
jgi:hypothetical protein